MVDFFGPKRDIDHSSTRIAGSTFRNVSVGLYLRPENRVVGEIAFLYERRRSMDGSFYMKLHPILGADSITGTTYSKGGHITCYGVAKILSVDPGKYKRTVGLLRGEVLREALIKLGYSHLYREQHE